MRHVKSIAPFLMMSAFLLLLPAAALAAQPVTFGHALVKVAHNAKLGTFLVNAKGMTLYYYEPEKHGKIECTGQCATFWPPLVLPHGAAPPATISGATGKFGVVTRPGGARQLTYNGWPLYTFVNDKKPGQTNGQGIQKVWWVVVVHKPSTSSGGYTRGGYSRGEW